MMRSDGEIGSICHRAAEVNADRCGVGSDINHGSTDFHFLLAEKSHADGNGTWNKLGDFKACHFHDLLNVVEMRNLPGDDVGDDFESGTAESNWPGDPADAIDHEFAWNAEDLLALRRVPDLPRVVDDLKDVAGGDGSADRNDGDVALTGHSFKVRSTDPDDGFGEIVGAEFLAAFADARCGVFDMGDNAFLNSTSRHTGGSFDCEATIALKPQNTHRDVRRP